MTLGRGAGLDESGRRRRVDRSPSVSEEDRLKAHLGDALGESVFERACIIHADRVPWERALAQAGSMCCSAPVPRPAHPGARPGLPWRVGAPRP